MSDLFLILFVFCSITVLPQQVPQFSQNMFNKFRGFNADDIPLALLLEKPLKQQGKLDEFKKEIQERLGFDWSVDAADAAAFQLQDA